MKATGEKIIQVEPIDGSAHRLGLTDGGARRFKEQTSPFERGPCRIEKAEIQWSFELQAHGLGEGVGSRIRGIFEKHGETVDQQGLGDAIEHRPQQRFEADFVGERAAEFDQGAAEVQAVAVEEMIELGLHEIAQWLEQKGRHHDGNHVAGRAGGPGDVEEFPDQRHRDEIDGDHRAGGEGIGQTTLENYVHVHQPVTDDRVAETQRDQNQRQNGSTHPGMQTVNEQRDGVQQEKRQYPSQRSAGNPFELLAQYAAGRAQIAAEENDRGSQEIKPQVDVLDLIQEMFVGHRGHEIEHLRRDANVQDQQARGQRIGGRQLGQQAAAAFRKDQGEVQQQGRLK